MSKTKALIIGQLLQKNISLVPKAQIQQKVYRQIKYEDTSYKIRIYDDCRSFSLKDLKKVYHESQQKTFTYNLLKQNQSLSFSPLFANLSAKLEKEERNNLRKKLKVETARNVRNLSLESETISALIDNDFDQRDTKDQEELEAYLQINKYELQVECRRKYRQNITSIMNYLTEKQPNPREIQQGKVKQISTQFIFHNIKGAIIVLALFANIISIIWKLNCIDNYINT